MELFDPAAGGELARKINDKLAATIRKHPDRFMGFACFAPKAPETAADELERTVKELGFKGWKTNSNFGDSYLDNERYWPVLARAEKLGVPIYLHPVTPSIPQLRTYGFDLARPAFGFGTKTFLTLMRLILSGALDKFPGLKIMVGHYGEGMPFLLERMNAFHGKSALLPGAKGRNSKKPSEYVMNNVLVTTSGNCFEPAFTCTYRALGIEKILFATDYPFDDAKECVHFLEGLPISQEERNQIYFLNAKRLGLYA